MDHPSYFQAFDIAALLRDYPIGDAFTRRYQGMSRDRLRALQEERFASLMARGWKTPFYERLWRGAGLEPGDVTRLDDIAKLPTYDKSDLMRSVAEHPPFGDFSGLSSYRPEERPPVILHTTSGTTGRPQPLLFGPKGREVGNLLAARMYRWQGLQPGDVVQSVYGHGMINGGHYIREAFTHFTQATFLSAGTGVETPSVKQVKLMADFGVTVLVGFVDYIRKLAEVARAQGYTPGEDIKIRAIMGHLGAEDRRVTEDAWAGAKAFDWYGVGDTGSIAGEGPEREGLYVWEDAHFLELLAVDGRDAVTPGAKGDMVVTCLYKDDVFPVIRFNTHDVSALKPGGNPHDLPFARIEGFLGRSDNMVKIKGINVFPHAVGALIEDRGEFTGEYVCRLGSDGAGRDAMTVVLEAHGAPDAAAARALLKQGLGIDVEVQFVGPGETAPMTGIETRQKPIRLIDARRGR